MSVFYTKTQVDSLAVVIGERIKNAKGAIPPLTQTLGQSTTSTVSQKLLTDTVGDIDAVLDAINGVVV